MKRNERCSCGSGKKYKKCCLGKQESDLAKAPDKGSNRRFREGMQRLESAFGNDPLLAEGSLILASRNRNRAALVIPQDDPDKIKEYVEGSTEQLIEDIMTKGLTEPLS